MKNIKQLDIKVFATFQSSVPCLANVQIWGILALNSSAKAKLEVQQIWTALTKARNNQKIQPTFYDSKPQCSSSSVKRKERSEISDVPNDFLGTFYSALIYPQGVPTCLKYYFLNFFSIFVIFSFFSFFFSIIFSGIFTRFLWIF